MKQTVIPSRRCSRRAQTIRERMLYSDLFCIFVLRTVCSNTQNHLALIMSRLWNIFWSSAQWECFFLQGIELPMPRWFSHGSTPSKSTPQSTRARHSKVHTSADPFAPSRLSITPYLSPVRERREREYGEMWESDASANSDEFPTHRTSGPGPFLGKAQTTKTQLSRTRFRGNNVYNFCCQCIFSFRLSTKTLEPFVFLGGVHKDQIIGLEIKKVIVYSFPPSLVPKISRCFYENYTVLLLITLIHQSSAMSNHLSSNSVWSEARS